MGDDGRRVYRDFEAVMSDLTGDRTWFDWMVLAWRGKRQANTQTSRKWTVA